MARTPITDVSIHPLPKVQKLDPAAGDQKLAVEASDPVNFNSVPCTGKECVFAHNADAAAQTITIHAAPDAIVRTGAITNYQLAAGESAIFGPFSVAGYKQADEMLWIDTSVANVELGILRLP